MQCLKQALDEVGKRRLASVALCCLCGVAKSKSGSAGLCFAALRAQYCRAVLCCTACTVRLSLHFYWMWLPAI